MSTEKLIDEFEKEIGSYSTFLTKSIAKKCLGVSIEHQIEELENISFHLIEVAKKYEAFEYTKIKIRERITELQQQLKELTI